MTATLITDRDAHAEELTVSALISARIAPLRRLSLAYATDLWAGDNPVTAYADLLVYQYRLMRATVPMMELALDEASRRSSPADRDLVPYLVKHIREEHGHEQWIVEDLLEFDQDAVERLQDPPGFAAPEIIGLQYYWIRHYEPVSILGYIILAEGAPPRLTAIARLRELTGLPSTAFRMLERHAKVDVHHSAELFAFTDGLSLNPGQVTAISTCAMHAAAGLAGIYRDLAVRHGRTCGERSTVMQAPPNPGADASSIDGAYHLAKE